jgi:hypothetical protein
MSWEAIFGHFDFSDIYDEAIASAPEGATVCEVGVMFGRSLAYLAWAARHRPDLQIIGVDPWEVDRGPRNLNPEGWGGVEYSDRIAAAGGPYLFFLSQMIRHAPAALERVRALRLTSVEAARLFPGNGGVHFCFIDGDHRYESVMQDLKAWWPKIRQGGMLAGHDWTNYESVQAAVTGFFGASSIQLQRSSWIVRKGT